MTWLQVWTETAQIVKPTRYAVGVVARHSCAAGLNSAVPPTFTIPSPRTDVRTSHTSEKMPDMADANRLKSFVRDLTDLIDDVSSDESRILNRGAPLLANLIAHDDWLPDPFSEPHTDHYQQYLLYCDPRERFSVVSFVWGPGHETPIHDHTVWGLVGILRGAERNTEYTRDEAAGAPTAGAAELCSVGDVTKVSPTIGDIHRVSNVSDAPSVSIHVYGANIGKVERRVYDEATGSEQSFISGYTSDVLPNIWS